METIQKQPGTQVPKEETQKQKLIRLADESAAFQKGVMIIELLCDTLKLERGCGFAAVSKRMKEAKTAFDELGEIVGYPPKEDE